MKRILGLLLAAAAPCLPAFAADKGISAADAAAIIATDFCGKMVGESPDDIERVAASIPGLQVSKPMTNDGVPEPFRTQFSGVLRSSPHALFHTIAFESIEAKSGFVGGLLQHDVTRCMVSTFKAANANRQLVERLQRAGSDWRQAPPERDANVYRRTASTQRTVAIMFLWDEDVTAATIYLTKPEPGSATAEDIDAFSREVMHACGQVVLRTGGFDAPFFEPHTVELTVTKEAPIVMKWRTKVPTAVVGLEIKDQGKSTSCRIISGDPIDAVPAIQAALIRAFMELPGATNVGGAGDVADGTWRYTIADPASGKKARMKIEPFHDRISALLEPVP